MLVLVWQRRVLQGLLGQHLSAAPVMPLCWNLAVVGVVSVPQRHQSKQTRWCLSPFFMETICNGERWFSWWCGP